MNSKPPERPAHTDREARLAKALRENLARRKSLVRAKRARAAEAPDSAPRGGEDAPS